MNRSKATSTVYVDQFIDGILDPEQPMIDKVKDGGHIIANTAPGCWGPMITPSIKGGHEVTKPVYVEGAEVGDAIAIKISTVRVTSLATSSGSDEAIDGRFIGDPFISVKCPTCATLYPESSIKDVGPDSIQCAKCGSKISPFMIGNGYTIFFDEEHRVGVTLPKEAAEKIGKDGHHYMKTPPNSVQNPAVTFAPHDMVGVPARLRPFLGQIGTTPSRKIPDSHNAGDFGSFLIDAPHEYSITQDEIEMRTDGHLDVNRVREGSILICPVKVPGGGIYVGDMHAMQGDGEIAGHTADVAGLVVMQVNVIKSLNNEGPILLPVSDDLPHLAQPFTPKEVNSAKKVAQKWGVNNLEMDSLPISIIGTGANLNEATDNGIKRGAKLLAMSEGEVLNRATISGSIEIGRHPGVVTVTFLVPKKILQQLKIYDLVYQQYKEYIE